MMAKSHHAAGACGGWRGGGWQRRELATRRLLRACVRGRGGHVARAAGAAQRSACIAGTARAAGLGGASGPSVARRLLRVCTGGRRGRVVRSAAAVERSACVAGTGCARAENLGWGTLVDAAETLG